MNGFEAIKTYRSTWPQQCIFICTHKCKYIHIYILYMLIYKPNKNLTKIRQPHLPVPFLFFFSSVFHSPAAALLRWSVGAPLLTLFDLYGKASQADLTRLRPNCPPGGNRLCRTSFTLGATRRQSCFRSVQLTDRLRSGS